MKHIAPDFVNHARKIIANMEFDQYHLTNLVVRQYNEVYGTNFSINCGAAREVIVCDSFVIKFDIAGHKTFGGNLQELRMYKQAVKDGFDYLFAPMFKIKVGKHYYYVMQYVKDTEKFDKPYIKDCVTSNEWDYILSHCYDLHQGNYGFTDDGYPMITDYACNTLW